MVIDLKSWHINVAIFESMQRVNYTLRFLFELLASECLEYDKKKH